MINRVLIRLKIVQIVYAYYQNGGKNLDTAEKELFFSLSKAYDMYNYLLLLMVEITKQAERKQSAAKNKLLPTAEELYPNTKFVDNRFIAQLEANKQLLEFSETQKKTWDNEAEFVKGLCEKIMASDIYKEYMASETSSYEEDRELWRKLYKRIIFNNDELDQVLEDQSLYWNDDKEIVDTFVLKTIRISQDACSVAQSSMLTTIVTLSVKTPATGISTVWHLWMSSSCRLLWLKSSASRTFRLA